MRRFCRVLDISQRDIKILQHVKPWKGSEIHDDWLTPIMKCVNTPALLKAQWPCSWPLIIHSQTWNKSICVLRDGDSRGSKLEDCFTHNSDHYLPVVLWTKFALPTKSGNLNQTSLICQTKRPTSESLICDSRILSTPCLLFIVQTLKCNDSMFFLLGWAHGETATVFHSKWLVASHGCYWKWP